MSGPEVTRSSGAWLWRWGWLILVAVALLLFIRSLEPGTTMAQGDVSVAGMDSVRESLPQGLYAMWYPVNGMGLPSTATPLTPGTLLTLVAPRGKAVDLTYVLSVILLGVGGFMLLRDLTRSSIASVVGGLWFMLQPHMFSHMQPGHIGYFLTCAWMPWSILFLRLGVRSRHAGWWILSGAAAGLTLTGQTDVGVLFLIFLVLYGLFLVAMEAFSLRRAGGGEGSFVLGVLLKGALAATAALLLGGQILVGMLQIFGHADSSVAVVSQSKTVDTQVREKWLWATQWSVPVEESLDFVVPGLFGWGSSHQTNPYRGRIGQTEGFPVHRQGLPNLNDVSNYLGPLIVLAALAALLARRRSAEVWFLAAAAFVACMLTFGKYAPFYRLVYELPFMSSMRNPIKWFVVTSICVGMLGSIGLAEVFSREGVLARLSVRGRLALCFVPGAIVVGAGVLFLCTRGSGPESIFWSGTAALDLGWGSLRTGAFLWAAAGGLFMWVLSDHVSTAAATGPRKASGFVAPVLVGVLLLVDMVNVDLRYLPCNDINMRFRKDALIEFFDSQTQPFRIYLTTLAGPYRQIDSLCENFAVERPYMPVSRTEDKSAVFIHRLGSDPKKMLLLTNVRFLVSPTRVNDPDFVPVLSLRYGDTPVIVHRFTNGLPRYYAVGRWQVVPEGEALDRMASQEFDPRQSVLIHAPPGEVPSPPAAPAEALCEVTDYKWYRVRMKVRSSQPSVVVGLDRFDSSWAAFVDGVRAPLWMADWMLRACPVPAGEHELELRLMGDGGKGLWATVLGWVFVVLAVLWVAFDNWRGTRNAKES